MTATPSETHEAALSDESLRELAAKLRKTTVDFDHAGLSERRGAAVAMLEAADAIDALARRTQPSAGEVVAWPLRRANVPHVRSEARVVGFIISPGDEAYGQYGLSEPLAWLDRMCAATPPDQSRVERLEAALTEIAYLPGTFKGETMRAIAFQALHGDRS